MHQPTHLSTIILVLLVISCSSSSTSTEKPLPPHEQRCASPASVNEASQSRPPRIAVAFFGLSRNLRLTLPLFEKYVFNVLDRHGIQHDVFWHSLTKTHMSNIHSGESGLKLNPHDVHLMNPCVYEVEEEGPVKEAEFGAFSKSRIGDGSNLTLAEYDPFRRFFRDNFESLKNMLCAFYSQFRLQQMITHHMKVKNITYDAILLLRPDTGVVFREVDLPEYLPSICRNGTRGVWTPDFQSWQGVNDRFAYGDVQSMLKYMQRGERYKQRGGKLTSGSGEKYLDKYLRKYRITNHASKVRLIRIRADGMVAVKDCLDEKILYEFGEQLKRCVTLVPRQKGSKKSSLGECTLRDVGQC